MDSDPRSSALVIQISDEVLLEIIRPTTERMVDNSIMGYHGVKGRKDYRLYESPISMLFADI